ncbi:MAG: sigma-70 family RNA polymerase sigma factor [Muribaculaceae bacterium]|nr:sigma-70 family RNA polymerase sigma factor [Muribaculaceae bacterium]
MKAKRELTDEQLVSAYAKGDNEAFDLLLQRHQQSVFNSILRLTKDRDLAEDIFQETFIKAIMFINQGRYTESGKFGAWITRIARNLVLDHFRQEKAERCISTDNEEVDILNRKDLCDDNIEDFIITEQIHNDVRRIIAALPNNQREVLIMRYYRNMSFKEIAEVTNVSINTALGRMRYALMNMRRIAEATHIVLTL